MASKISQKEIDDEWVKLRRRQVDLALARQQLAHEAGQTRNKYERRWALGAWMAMGSVLLPFVVILIASLF